MKQVYLFEPSNDKGAIAPTKIIVKSSREKAIGYCRGEFNKPNFEGDKEFITVSADERIVGWITKKLVQ